MWPLYIKFNVPFCDAVTDRQTNGQSAIELAVTRATVDCFEVIVRPT